MFTKIAIFAVVVVTVSAGVPVPYDYPAVAASKHIQPPYVPEPYEAPEPYSFGYETTDEFGNTQSRHEGADGTGAVSGSYGYTDVYGTHRQVEYVADANGYRAVVKTNEPGTSNANPANVEVLSEEAPLSHPTVTNYKHPLPLSHPAVPVPSYKQPLPLPHPAVPSYKHVLPLPHPAVPSYKHVLPLPHPAVPVPSYKYPVPLPHPALKFKSALYTHPVPYAPVVKVPTPSHPSTSTTTEAPKEEK
ncbi:uncharacterized protein LOC143248703 [Tachypleus tridentatus]|uniref:uncharacterized protein LOC143248703 n=1 Tax=Tachypleus tridentatus TaxID=6853 RepID=UPI003FD1B3FF